DLLIVLYLRLVLEYSFSIAAIVKLCPEFQIENDMLGDASEDLLIVLYLRLVLEYSFSIAAIVKLCPEFQIENDILVEKDPVTAVITFKLSCFYSFTTPRELLFELHICWYDFYEALTSDILRANKSDSIVMVDLPFV
ncbi:hypothetical protein Tco_1472887, partial [Tanacetum coccineum]